MLGQADRLSQKLQIEIQKSQSRFQQLVGLREQMAKYIQAADEFLLEYPRFVRNQHPLDNFSERLAKKIYSLKTLQSSNDIAITQMQLSQQLSFSLLDRFKEAQQVLDSCMAISCQTKSAKWLTQSARKAGSKS